MNPGSVFTPFAGVEVTLIALVHSSPDDLCRVFSASLAQNNYVRSVSVKAMHYDCLSARLLDPPVLLRPSLDDESHFGIHHFVFSAAPWNCTVDSRQVIFFPDISRYDYLFATLTLRQMFSQAVAAVHRLHELGWSHGHITPRKFCVARSRDERWITLTDFSRCAELTEDSRLADVRALGDALRAFFRLGHTRGFAGPRQELIVDFIRRLPTGDHTLAVLMTHPALATYCSLYSLVVAVAERMTSDARRCRKMTICAALDVQGAQSFDGAGYDSWWVLLPARFQHFRHRDSKWSIPSTWNTGYERSRSLAFLVRVIRNKACHPEDYCFTADMQAVGEPPLEYIRSWVGWIPSVVAATPQISLATSHALESTALTLFSPSEYY